MIKHYCDLHSYSLGLASSVSYNYSWFKAYLVSEIHRATSLYSFNVSQGYNRLLAARNSVIHRAISLNNWLPSEPIGLRECFLIHHVKFGTSLIYGLDR
jgi:hypothetical protein